MNQFSIDELFESWAEMFTELDNIFDKVDSTNTKLDLDNLRNAIKTAHSKTNRLAKIIESGKQKSQLSSLQKSTSL